MLMNTVRRVMWLGRATIFLVGLSMVLALVVGAAMAALGSDGDFFKVGRSNDASSVTSLTKSGPGPALRLNVGSGPPLQVDSTGKVARLNVDRLDGKDSRALGVTIRTDMQRAGSCTSPGIWSACSQVRVVVPPGRRYNVTVLSSFAAMSNSDGSVRYCPGIQGGGYELSCMNPTVQNAEAEFMRLAASYTESAATSGEITVGPGTYFFSTVLNSDVDLVVSYEWSVHTTLIVTDASAPGPPIG